jgi:hypothetical protein
VTAITQYLKVLDRLDRYQTVACANQVYDDEARQKLMDKINRVAANLGYDKPAKPPEGQAQDGADAPENADPGEDEKNEFGFSITL